MRSFPKTDIDPKIPSFMLLNCRAHLFSFIIAWTIFYNKILERDWFSRSCGCGCVKFDSILTSIT